LAQSRRGGHIFQFARRKLFCVIERREHPTPMTFDDATLLSRVEGNRDLLRAMVDAFIGEAPQLLREIEGAIKRADSGALFNAAHALKGALATLEAHTAARIAAKLERSGQLGHFADTDYLLAALGAEVNNLQADLMLLLNVPVE